MSCISAALSLGGLSRRGASMAATRSRVEAGLRDVLDLGSVDDVRVARVVHHSAHGLAPGVLSPLAA